MRTITAVCMQVAFLAMGCGPLSCQDEPARAAEDRATSIIRLADAAVTKLGDLEAAGGPIPWTHHRRLDWAFAKKRASYAAMVVEIAARKGLLRAVWAKASQSSAGTQVTAGDIAALDLAPGPLAEKLAATARDIGIDKTALAAASWRLVVSVLMDELRFDDIDLKPLSVDGLETLADAAGVLSVRLLAGAAKAAAVDDSPTIEIEHIQRAYDAVSDELGLVNPPRPGKVLPAAEVAARLRPLTEKLIEARIDALLGDGDGRGNLMRDLGRASRVTLAPEAAAVLVDALRSAAHLAAAGTAPMRADNYLAGRRYAPGEMARLAYVDATHIANTIAQRFPHQVMASGEVTLRYAPNPAPVVASEREAFKLALDAREIASVRESGVHWIVLRTAWREAPFAMDPFAAAHLADVLAMQMTAYLRRAEALAGEGDKAEIDAAIARAVFTDAYILVPPAEATSAAWIATREKNRDRALEAYEGALFVDWSAEAGLSRKVRNLEGKARAKGGEDRAEGQDPAPLAVEDLTGVQALLGGGIAVGDVNADGYPDLFLAGEGLGRLLLNRGAKAPGRFRDVTERFAIPAAIDDAQGSLFFDLEGDDDLDLLILRRAHPAMILRQVSGRFENVAPALGFTPHRGAQAAAIFDYDRDGDLDIYVGYYGAREANAGKAKDRGVPSLSGRNGSANELWQMQADGRFVEVAAKAGVADTGWTIALSTFDHDTDGDLDLYIANHFGPDKLYRNLGNGTFADATVKTSLGDRGSNASVAVAELNGDGRWDLYVTGIDMFAPRGEVVFPREASRFIDDSIARAFWWPSGNKLYVGREEAFALAGARRFAPGDRGWGWDASFFDYEHDGDLDLYLANGWIEGTFAGDQKNQLLINDDGSFYLADEGDPAAFAGQSRSLGPVDFDRDGDIDLVVNNFRQRPVALKNAQQSGHHWLQLRLHGRGKNTRAIGALVTVTANGTRYLRQVTCGRGYLGQADRVLTIGLGEATAAQVEIRWPDGEISTHSQLTIDTLHDIQHPRGT